MSAPDECFWKLNPTYLLRFSFMSDDFLRRPNNKCTSHVHPARKFVRYTVSWMNMCRRVLACYDWQSSQRTSAVNVITGCNVNVHGPSDLDRSTGTQWLTYVRLGPRSDWWSEHLMYVVEWWSLSPLKSPRSFVQFSTSTIISEHRPQPACDFTYNWLTYQAPVLLIIDSDRGAQPPSLQSSTICNRSRRPNDITDRC